ncbi:putative reverse transcriptase domain-containing protein [Tanacetum coccineum]
MGTKLALELLSLLQMKLSGISNIVTANGLRVETNKIVHRCSLELEDHTFTIELIPFGYGSFDVIVGMDWMSKRRAKIICHKKIVWIPLSNGKILKVRRARPIGNLKHVKSMKTYE